MLDVMQNDGVRARRAPECLLCRTPGHGLYTGLRDEIGRAPGIWDLRVCPACGLVWLDPRPLSEEIGKLYDGYYTHAPGDAWEWLPYTWGIRRRASPAVLAAGFGYPHPTKSVRRAIVGSILSRFTLLTDIFGATVMWLPSSPSAQLLDVGCGGGHFLARMRSLRWQVRGVEPDAEAASLARERGLNVFHGTLADARFPPNEFDAVTMNHVIEHVPNPIELLQECRRVLKISGRLVIVTPNAASLGRSRFARAWKGWEPPRHLFLFTPHTLRVCAERAALRVETLRTTARMAPVMWTESARIRHRQFTGQTQDERVGWRMRQWSRLMGLYEHALGANRAAGEEVVLVARKK
jgi:2-polyprenyl-3-methyl-5-hydroxy-6-metoxy-1,4-benzoquinol methylase